MTELKCKFEQDEICVNADCPLCADFCQVCYTPDVCKFEEREEVKDNEIDIRGN